MARADNRLFIKIIILLFASSIFIYGIGVGKYSWFPYNILSYIYKEFSLESENIWENRDPDQLGMVAVEGVEISSTRHLGSHFNDFRGEGSSDVDYVLNEIEKRNGLAQFFHPGRYTEDDPEFGVFWYANLYKNYNCLVGMEVYNRADRHPQDRQFWDNVLMNTLPDKVIWAFGNDDNHVNDPDWDFLVSWNIFILEELNLDNVKQAYRNGVFFACNKTGENAPDPPKISNIVVEDNHILIFAQDYNDIIWIANGDIVASGPSIEIPRNTDWKYARAKLINIEDDQQGRLLTQPFIIKNGEKIINPYEKVNWETYEQYKANFHTHTTYSDGNKAPHEIIDEYYQNKYSILALTDHDTYNPEGPLTYPWTKLSEISIKP